MKEKEKYLYDKGYRISKDGVCTNPQGKILIGSLDKHGYPKIGVRAEGKCFAVHMHRLQAYIKFGDMLYTEGLIVRHVDSHRLNYKYDNILLGTYSENMYDKHPSLRKKQGKITPGYELKHGISEIITYYKNSKSFIKTMKHFNIQEKEILYNILKPKL